jgi:hypothetical protein
VASDSVFSSPAANDKDKKPFLSPGTLAKFPAEMKMPVGPPPPLVWKAVPENKPAESIAVLSAVSAVGSGLVTKVPAKLPANAATMVSAVKTLMVSDERYRGLRFEVKQSRVYLSGVVFRWADLHELSGAISRIAGVEAVVFQDIRDEPKKK